MAQTLLTVNYPSGFKPVGLETAITTSYSALIKWHEIEGASTYSVLYSGADSVKSVTSIINSVNLSFLSPGEKYEWIIRANCNTASSVYTSWSAVRDFTLPNAITKQANELISDVKLYPVPVEQELNIQWVSKETMELNVTVYSVTGSLFYQRRVNAMEGLNNIVLDASQWPQGSYLVQFGSGYQSVTFNKLIP